MAISAAQLVYTNVEKALSPGGQEGYQIWLKTPGFLSDADETEIRSRLGDFEERHDATTEGTPLERHTYFTLSSGKAVIARTVALEGTDKFNRGGRFYAHAVALNPDDFLRLKCDPFAVMDQVRFQSSIDEGAAAGDVRTGMLPALALQPWTGEAADPVVPADKVPMVLPGLLRACQRDKPAIIGVSAAPRQVLALARQLWSWLPPSLRRSCGIDSLSNGRNLTQMPFAFAGLPAVGAPRRYLNLLMFDLARGGFTQPVPASTIASYDQWLLKQVPAGRPPPLERHEAAYHLGACLDSGNVQPGTLGGVDRALFEEIACHDLGVPKVERILRARLLADAGEVLASMLFAHAYNWLRSSGLAGFEALAEPLPADLLLRWLVAIYEQRQRREVHREIEVPALKDVLEKYKATEGESGALRKQLVLILYRWAAGWARLARSICDPRTVTDDIFQWFVEWSLRTLPIKVTLGSGPTLRGGWCGPEVSARDPGDDEECRHLVGAILGRDPRASADDSAAEADRPRLPSERWAWVLNHLLMLAQL